MLQFMVITVFGLPTMRNSTYPPNSAPNQMPTQQAPPQQPQVNYVELIF